VPRGDFLGEFDRLRDEEFPRFPLVLPARLGLPFGDPFGVVALLLFGDLLCPFLPAWPLLKVKDFRDRLFGLCVLEAGLLLPLADFLPVEILWRSLFLSSLGEKCGPDLGLLEPPGLLDADLGAFGLDFRDDLGVVCCEDCCLLRSRW
jgi:hypothetical protein